VYGSRARGMGERETRVYWGVEEGWDMEIKEIEWENNINYII
jgi:hypothetical protein